MDHLKEARQMVDMAGLGEGPETRTETILLAIADALIAIGEELHEMNKRAEFEFEREEIRKEQLFG